MKFSRPAAVLSTLACGLLLAFLLAVAISPETAHAATKRILPESVVNAQTIYIEDQTGEDGVLNAASKEFKKWGRFAIVGSRNDADLTIVFTRKNGMDIYGNLGFIVMNVYLKGTNTPVFESKSAVHFILAPQHRTIQCISDFAAHLEAQD